MRRAGRHWGCMWSLCREPCERNTGATSYTEKRELAMAKKRALEASDIFYLPVTDSQRSASSFVLCEGMDR